MSDNGAVQIIAPSTRENIHVKAMRTLLEGRVGIMAVRPGRVEAWVRCTHAHIHRVTWGRGGWACDCAARGRELGCSHAEAVALVVVLPDGGIDEWREGR